MSKSGPSGVRKAWGSAYVSWPYTALPRTPPLSKVAKRQGNKFPVTKFLAILAACLGSVFVASIVLEAFDNDLDLWPFGAENFTVAAQDQPATSGQPFSVSFALNPLLWFVVTAGAHLVIRHRARSALATDSPSIFVVSTMAEPRWQGLNPAPALGHLFLWLWSDCCAPIASAAMSGRSFRHPRSSHSKQQGKSPLSERATCVARELPGTPLAFSVAFIRRVTSTPGGRR